MQWVQHLKSHYSNTSTEPLTHKQPLTTPTSCEQLSCCLRAHQILDDLLHSSSQEDQDEGDYCGEATSGRDTVNLLNKQNKMIFKGEIYSVSFWALIILQRALTCSSAINKKNKFAYLLNWSKRNLGKNVRMLYFVVLIRFEQNLIPDLFFSLSLK